MPRRPRLYSREETFNGNSFSLPNWSKVAIPGHRGASDPDVGSGLWAGSSGGRVDHYLDLAPGLLVSCQNGVHEKRAGIAQSSDGHTGLGFCQPGTGSDCQNTGNPTWEDSPGSWPGAGNTKDANSTDVSTTRRFGRPGAEMTRDETCGETGFSGDRSCRTFHLPITPDQVVRGAVVFERRS